MDHRRFIAGIVCGLSLLGAPEAHADDFRFIRRGDPDRIFNQSEALAIALPPNLSQGELGTLFLELDGIDITQVVRLENGQVVFYPSSPYAAGSHALRLVRMGRNGKLVEINRWKFTVSGAPPVQSPSSVAGTVDATYSYMPWERDDPDDHLDRHNVTSQVQVQGATQTEGWQLAARGNGFINTEDSFNPAGARVEAGEYLLSAERPAETVSTLLRLGHHDIGASNLLMDNFYRRGASAAFDINQHQATVAGFAQNPAPSIGNHNITGADDAGQRANGVHATLRPIPALNEKFELEGTAYQGRGMLNTTTTTTGTPTGSLGVVPGSTRGGMAGVETSDNAGNGYQLGMRSVLMEKYLSLRTQYAKADFDSDGRHIGIGAENDDAYRLAFLVTPLGNSLAEDGRLRQWNVELAYQNVGTFYQTLINPILEGDRAAYSFTSSYLYGGTTLDGQMNWMTNNVNGLAGIPEDGSFNGWAQASYAPEEEIFGRPVFFLGGMFNDEKRRDTPVLYSGPNLDRLSASLNGGVSMSYENTVWSLTHTYSRLTDSVTATNEYYSHFTDLTVEFRPAQWLTLRPGVQVEFLDEKMDGVSTGYHASLGADVILIPNTFWNNTNVSTLLNRGYTPAGDDYNAQTEFTWLLKPAEVNSPGYAIALAGIYDDLSDVTPITGAVPGSTPANLMENKDARIFLRLKVSAPFAY